MRFLSIEEEISIEDDIKHMVEASALAPVVVVIFRISILWKVLSLPMMNEKNTNESYALIVTRMGTLWKTVRTTTNRTIAEKKIQIWSYWKESH